MKAKTFILLWLSVTVLAACQAIGAQSSKDAAAHPLQSPTITDNRLQSPTTEVAAQPTASATAEPPSSFQSELLRPGIVPASYINDACQYLELRWNPAKSAPGTVVAPIMYHSIRPRGEAPEEPSAINADTFEATIRLAEQLGFETITSGQLLAFLQENAKIPRRSMILILDDRRPGTAEDYFLPALERNGWTATLAWIIGDTDQRQTQGRLPGESLWGWIERLNDTGYFDIQSHGLNSVPVTEAFPEKDLREEIFGSIPVLEQHFGHRPILYIWPGGNYTRLGVQIAREAGFKLGFTVHSRGPILFNWIPQGDSELAINDPLMLLPRYWSSAAVLNLSQAAEIGDAARAFAAQNYAAEADWYQANCRGPLPALEDVLKQP